MKYLKAYKIFESIEEDFFEKLPISKEDISDIFLDVTDLDYILEISQYYLSSDGKTLRSIGINDYHPVIHLSIHKYIDDKYGDISNWDGGIFYDEKQEIIDSIYHSVSMLRSKLSGFAKVLIAFNNMDNINIRIVLDKVKVDGFTFKEFGRILFKLCTDSKNSKSNDFSILKNLYHGPYMVDKNEVIITPNLDELTDYNNPKTRIDFIINRIVSEGDSDNRSQLNSCFGEFIRNLQSEIRKRFPNISINMKSDMCRFYDKETGDIYLEMFYDYDQLRFFTIVDKKGLFKPKVVREINLYEMIIDIKYKF
jgi:hypothetical protein